MKIITEVRFHNQHKNKTTFFYSIQKHILKDYEKISIGNLKITLHNILTYVNIL